MVEIIQAPEPEKNTETDEEFGPEEAELRQNQVANALDTVTGFTDDLVNLEVETLAATGTFLAFTLGAGEVLTSVLGAETGVKQTKAETGVGGVTLGIALLDAVERSDTDPFMATMAGVGAGTFTHLALDGLGHDPLELLSGAEQEMSSALRQRPGNSEPVEEEAEKDGKPSMNNLYEGSGYRSMSSDLE